MAEKQIRTLLVACYTEFCEIVGDSLCSCEVCPYEEFCTDEGGCGCKEAYIKDKLGLLKLETSVGGTENELDFSC